jgi:clan AA aspartic protease (TIGR02281 family)
MAMNAAGTARAQDQAPEDVLKSHSLKRAGSSYVVPGEAEVQREMAKARLISQQLNAAVMQQAAFEEGEQGQKALIEELKAQRMMLNEELTAVDQQLNVAGAGATANYPLAMQRNQLTNQHNQLVAADRALTDRINLLQSQFADPEVRQRIYAEASEKRGAYMEAILELRQLVDKTTDAYAGLAKDETITKALEALTAKLKARPPLKLGPSAQYLANVKLLERVEKTVLTDKVELRRNRGGVDEVDVTINGKLTVPMIFDTGAAITTISTDLAARIGVKPRPNDPSVRLKVANGATVDAKRVTIPSIRVGRFTVNNVACVVVPQDKGEVSSLLGQSFHRHFKYNLTPGSGVLVMSKVETMEPQPRAGRTTKNSPKKKQARRPYRSVAPDAAGDADNPF